MKWFLVTLIAASALFFGQSADAQARRTRITMHSLEVGGVTRNYGLYVPASVQAGQPAPVIVALHGRFSSAQAMHAMTDLARVADASGAIIAYPETVGGFWNDGGYAPLGRTEAPQDDSGFIRAMLQAIGREHAVEPARIFLVGYDAGGGMAFALACASDTPFAGVAVVSSLMWSYHNEACQNSSRATPILIVHGRRDEYYPANGGGVRGAQIEARRLGVEQTVSTWRRINACEGVRARGRGGSAIYQCAAAPVIFVAVAGGAHEWFRTDTRYQINRPSVDASALIGDFFFNRDALRLPESSSGARPPRAFIVYAAPEYDPAHPAPLLVMLHGRPSNAAAMAQITQMNRVAAANGFLVAYPDGLDNEWNNEIELSGGPSRRRQDDVAFLDALPGELSQDFNIDANRIYLAGFSNGGFMVHRMACSSTGPYAAYAEVGAALYSAMRGTCTRGRHAPILIMHGTADPSIPYTGVVFEGAPLTSDGFSAEATRVTLSVPETVEFFIRRNGCSLSGLSTQLPERGESPGTNVIRFAPRDCDGGADVLFYLINGGGHTWPGETSMAAESFGPTNMDFRASEAIWSFFESHGRDRQQP